MTAKVSASAILRLPRFQSTRLRLLTPLNPLAHRTSHILARSHVQLEARLPAGDRLVAKVLHQARPTVDETNSNEALERIFLLVDDGKQVGRQEGRHVPGWLAGVAH